ncbi:FT-interacting protein [Trifolium repens]|nr:FT-interacting protein [Trifolium repens]
MLDIRGNVWNMRRGRAMFYRISGLLGGFVSLVKEIEEICSCKNSWLFHLPLYYFHARIYFASNIYLLILEWDLAVSNKAKERGCSLLSAGAIQEQRLYS